MKKILFMISSLNIGGVEKSLLSLLSVISKEEYEVTILTLEKTGGFLNYVPKWVKIEEGDWFKLIKPVIMQPPQQTVRHYFKTKQYIKIIHFIYAYLLSKYFGKRFFYYKHIFKDIPKDNRSFDVAVSYQGPTEFIDYYIAKKVKAKRKIAWVHFDVSKHVINKDLYIKVYQCFDSVFAVSNESKERLIQKIPTVRKKAEVFYNIVDKKFILEMAKSPVCLDSKYNGIKIVTVGRLTLEKGQDLAINVLRKLRDEGIEARWYCIGDGKHKREYQNLIEQLNLQNDFILLGATPNPYPYMAQADLYIQTSRHEGFCLTLAEAKCFHKPIISTGFSGAREQLNNVPNSIIVNFDENELAAAVKCMLDKGPPPMNTHRAIVNN